MNNTAKILAVLGVIGAGVFLTSKANASETLAPRDNTDPMGSASISGGSNGLASVLGSGLASLGGSSAGSSGSAGRTGTAATTGATGAGAAGVAATGSTGATAADAAVYEAAGTAAEAVNVMPSWVSPIEAAWKSGGVDAVLKLEADNGVGSINAGQARAIWNLSDADVGFLQNAGVLSGNITAA